MLSSSPLSPPHRTCQRLFPGALQPRGGAMDPRGRGLYPRGGALGLRCGALHPKGIVLHPRGWPCIPRVDTASHRLYIPWALHPRNEALHPRGGALLPQGRALHLTGGPTSQGLAPGHRGLVITPAQSGTICTGLNILKGYHAKDLGVFGAC